MILLNYRPSLAKERAYSSLNAIRMSPATPGAHHPDPRRITGLDRHAAIGRLRPAVAWLIGWLEGGALPTSTTL